MKVGVVDIDVCLLNHSKEKLTWAVDKHGFGLLALLWYLNHSKELKGTKE